MEEKCPCQIYIKSCCACVSMHCDECHGHSKFVQGRFCSNCGRPLKAELTRLYVPKSEVDKWKEINEQLHKEMSEQMIEERKIERNYVARKIFEEIEKIIQDRKNEEIKRQGDNKMISPFTYSFGALELIEFQFAELKKKYTEGING